LPVAFVLNAPGMTTEVYDRAMETLKFDENWPEGLQSHHAAVTPDGLFIFDVWDTREDWERFAQERLGAALAEATGGNAPELEPTFYPLHREERS
jgi:hypothetical protein